MWRPQQPHAAITEQLAVRLSELHKPQFEIKFSQISRSTYSSYRSIYSQGIIYDVSRKLDTDSLIYRKPISASNALPIYDSP
jgi:hypothetical protein